MNKGAILPLFYLPPIEFFSHLVRSSEILIERFEHFPKQTYRNRTTIQSPNGRLDLIVPVVRGSKAYTPVKDVRISYDLNWQRLHWMSIQTSYRSSTYFEFYENDFAKFYETKAKYLFDFNEAILQLLLMHLKIDKRYNYTAAFEKGYDNFTDFRHTVNPKNYSLHVTKPYFQVFEERNGFLPNLSVVDLLFSQGPQSRLYF